jgi:2-isopropylmalate synthase
VLKNPASKYRPFAPINLPDRTWVNQIISHPPTWLSTDLRDGNQALIEPMNIERKLRMFNLLISIGFKEIEVGFPSASQTDFDFVRYLIEQQLIPDDVKIQVLTPAREELIRRSFEALDGAKQAIVHLYNATSPVFRRTVLGLDREGTINLAASAATLFNQLAATQPETNWQFQYSPETFTATELEFAKIICDRVLDIWKPTPENKAIINLPATVEVSTPNIFADQVEWMHRNLNHRDSIILCVHPHNDRGCGVAAAELAQMAGAERVEGCLFG